MAEVNAQISTNEAVQDYAPGRDSEGYRLSGDANLRRPVTGRIYMYNVSNIEHRIERPWVAPQRLGKCIVLPACAAGEKYSKPFVIPEVIQEVTPRIAGSKEFINRGVEGSFYAQDALCPDQPHANWRTMRPMNAAQMTGEGTNLYILGCFWTDKNPPEPEAVAKATELWVKTANELILQGNILAQSGKVGDITNTMHLAADYLHVNVDWHRKYRAEVTCPGCGDYVPQGIARHMKAECRWVFDWQRALDGGQATMDEAIAAGVMKPPKATKPKE